MEDMHCVNESPECSGEVDYREPLSGTGQSYPRCDHHWEVRLVEQDRIERTYPRLQPADFDPSYAGEAWSEEDY